MQRVLTIASLTLGLLWCQTGLADTGIPDGFTPLFNGKDLSGWKVYGGQMNLWAAENGLLVVKGQGGGWLMTEKEYADFEIRLEYKVPREGNSGVALRSPLEGNPAFAGMEIQILDDPNYKGLKPTQYTGSIYDVVPPSKRVTKPAGEWNEMQITARGRQITIEINGSKVVDANLDAYKERALADPKRKKAGHPGLLREKGHLGLQSHTDRVEFRNIYVKSL